MRLHTAINVALLLLAATSANARMLRQDTSGSKKSFDDFVNMIVRISPSGTITMQELEDGSKILGSSLYFQLLQAAADAAAAASQAASQASTSASSTSTPGRRLQQSTDVSFDAFVAAVQQGTIGQPGSTTAVATTTAAAATNAAGATNPAGAGAAAATTTAAAATNPAGAATTAATTTPGATADPNAATAVQQQPAATDPAATAQQQPAAVANPTTAAVGAATLASSDGGYALQAQNAMRAKHGAAPLTWSAALQAKAQSWADTCSNSHSGAAGLGENIAWGGGINENQAIDMWNSEAPLYRPGGGFQDDAAHWTQIVWKETQQVGCGYASCGGQGFVVCNYSPPGNWIDRMDANVTP